MARKKIREYDSKRFLKQHLKRLASIDLQLCSAQVEMGGCEAPITTFIVEPFVPHDQEYYLSIVSERLGSTVSYQNVVVLKVKRTGTR